MTTEPNTPAGQEQDEAPKKSRRFAGRRSATGIGGLGVLILVMIAVASFYLKDLPLLGAGAQYTASFSEAAGLKPGNEVRVAGIKVGEVTGVELDGDRVDVHFRANNTWIGDQSQLSIQIKTVLGQKYLAVNPRGSELADPSVKFTDTVAPYDVIEAFGDAANQIENVDTDNVAKSLRTLSNAFSGTAGDIGPSLEGISRLSNTIASRDQEVQRLLRATKDSSKILADRNQEFTRLIAGAGTLLQELNHRQDDISALLASTTTLSRALTGIVRDNENQIGPALDSLKGVTDMLTRQNQNLRDTITYMAPFYRLYANVLGNGRWFESAVTNLLPPALPQQNTTRPPNMQKNLNNGGMGVR
ncbi:ABC transporter substrate-binding protein [Gordonia spumicola]|uniref:ABC transporter substrate-binding protein n=1 Tax=Gordonia spumicola TaxID=589161 RepID=A0A7I9V2W7_9ACTN|nr:MCE family protein [Gordonia spumicola]GED99744.1 ABC transporter substrate-binding protein [Gordonia spumicola]